MTKEPMPANMELLKVANEVILKLKGIIKGHEKAMRVSLKDGERCVREIRELREENKKLHLDTRVNDMRMEIGKLKGIIVGYEETLREAYEELKRCSPNAPVVGKIANGLWARLGKKL